MRNNLTPEAQQGIERMWELRQEAVELLGVISAEFESDPTSVASFDLRTVNRSIAVTKELETLSKRFPLF